MNDEEFYSDILGLKNVWTVIEVILNLKGKTVIINIEHGANEALSCSECGENLQGIIKMSGNGTTSIHVR